MRCVRASCQGSHASAVTTTHLGIGDNVGLLWAGLIGCRPNTITMQTKLDGYFGRNRPQSSSGVLLVLSDEDTPVVPHNRLQRVNGAAPIGQKPRHTARDGAAVEVNDVGNNVTGSQRSRLAAAAHANVSGSPSSVSDDDAPLVPRRRLQRDATATIATQSQQRARGAAADIDGDSADSPHRRFEGEAEECSDHDEDDDDRSDDSFVVSDHASDCGSSSSDDVPFTSQLRSVCASLRNRRKCAQCPQCLRLMRAISAFMSEISTAVRSSDHD